MARDLPEAVEMTAFAGLAIDGYVSLALVFASL